MAFFELADVYYGRGDLFEAAALYRSVGDTVYAILPVAVRRTWPAWFDGRKRTPHTMPPWTRAHLYADQGMHDRTFASLEAALQSRDRWVPFHLRFPTLIPLHSDARFRRLREAMGL